MSTAAYWVRLLGATTADPNVPPPVRPRCMMISSGRELWSTREIARCLSQYTLVLCPSQHSRDDTPSPVGEGLLDEAGDNDTRRQGAVGYCDEVV